MTDEASTVPTPMSMERQLAAMREKYVEKLGDRINELAGYLHEVSKDDVSHDDRMAALEQVRQAVHKLAGSGATFGFPAVTDIARQMEAACIDVLEGPSEYKPEVADLQYELCGSLRAAAKAPSESVAEETQEIVRATKLRTRAGDHQKSVLVFECNAQEGERIQHEMEHFGFQVRVINHPELLEAELAKGNVDVVLSGLTFGDDKEITLKVLGELHEKGAITAPLLMHTSLDGIEHRLGAARVGARAYMVKPIDMADLVSVIDEVTQRIEQEPFRVLIIDDDESIALHTELVLHGSGMETKVLTNPLGVLDALDEFSPELILLDLYMPESKGSDVASVIRQRHEYAGIPIVFLSGESDKDKQLSAMELGGDDFLTKPIRPSHLISSVRIRASRFRKLRSFMVRDSMTGLYNHTTTKQLMETEIARAKRSGSKMSLASLDIDHFKNVNDTYGHAVGDRVIKTLARLMRQRLRSVDVIGRMGGEEFSAILPDTSVDEAVKLFDQIRTAFSEIVFHADEASFTVTISTGIAEFPGYDSSTLLSDAADKALYAVKHGGRNQVLKAD